MAFLQDLANFYFPIFLTFTFIIFQTYFSKKGKLKHALILAISFTILIQAFFLQYDFLVVLIMSNFFFYMMAVVTYFTRPRF
ncbi:hypothetical protein A0U40_14335 [[Bacillus] sp. KCTC 13219]|nr:hypothetical protein A0U40_14335 [[Bacillus] sp. KCTC 13219]